MDDKNSTRYLAWFLGPKAEHAELFEKDILFLLRDYIHWRRNYFPGDRALISQRIQRTLADNHDRFFEDLLDLTSNLRRNFPFYSPRYIGHQLSDVTMPWMVGYIASLLYNANNVTPQAAPVTVDLEIEACSTILEMLGYRKPPTPPLSRGGIAEYEDDLLHEFGWAHITHGGTTANIEALWIARAVRYFPLAVKWLAAQHDLDVIVTMPGNPDAHGAVNSKQITELTREDFLTLRPNDSIFLFAKFAAAVQKKFEMSTLGAAATKVEELLRDCPVWLSHGTGQLFAEYPPVIFCTGAAHYSIDKAADILGVGRSNIIQVDMSSQFRMDPIDLERKVREAVRDGKVPLAVIGIVGTTEEGAVDPIDEIKDLRERLQNGRVTSFWLHIDAAWGGFLRALFRDFDTVLHKLGAALGVDYLAYGSVDDWHEAVISVLRSALDREHTGPILPPEDGEKAAVQHLDSKDVKVGPGDGHGQTEPAANAFMEPRAVAEHSTASDSATVNRDTVPPLPGPVASLDPSQVVSARRDLDRFDVELRKSLRSGDYLAYASQLQAAIQHGRWGLEPLQVKVTRDDQVGLAQEFVSDTVTVGIVASKARELEINWGSRPLSNAFLAFRFADSITVDPHKMGYAGYPCGVIAFRNDRVRHFVTANAPYISVTRTQEKQKDKRKPEAPRGAEKPKVDILSQPPRHLDQMQAFLDDPTKEPVIETDAFAKFILEGSRPGASAGALWLALRTIPPDMKHHGLVVRSSLLAARELYEWIAHWEQVTEAAGTVRDYALVPLPPQRPDTNIVTFVVTHRTRSSLTVTNKMTESVYSRFAIQPELGERQYSYSQPFFLSKTECEPPLYPYKTLAPFFERAHLSVTPADYANFNLSVLRASVMNPYIHQLRTAGIQDVIKEFMLELKTACEMAAFAVVADEQRTRRLPRLPVDR
jgi:glutamate/tyrosine decarboxylase-like PLP-dependent enzyme